MPTRTRFARLATFFRSRERLFRFSFCVGAKDVVGAGRERHIIDDGKGREKRSRSPNSGDQQEVAKSQTLTSPGEAAKAVEAETSPCSQKADCSGVASGGSGGGCSTVAESTSASLGPFTSPERKEEGRDDGKGREKRPRSASPGDQKLIKVAKSQASSSPGEAAKAMEAETSPCSRKTDCSGVASGGSGGGCSTVAESASAEGIKRASSGPSVLEAEEDVGPARDPTVVEKALLASMSRRSYNVPLRLDTRER